VLTEREELLLAQYIERYRHSEAGRLVKGIVHNMNNLLHTLSMQVELLRRRMVSLASIGEPEKFRQEKERCLGKIDEVTGELARLNDLIANIISKGIHDQSQEPGPVDLNALLSEELTLRYADMFYKHKVEKKIELEPGLPPVYGFHVDYAQALGAIIQNALEAMEGAERREMSITTAQENGRVVVRVRDSGCGLANANAERIFEPLFTTKDTANGHAGLGLYLARTLLSAYGGEITATGGAEGATVSISVPPWTKRAR
jgi:signal transduction histidine kinase